MKLWVTLDGRDAEVEFRAEGETLWVELEGRTLSADFHRLPDGEVYSLLVNGRSHEVRVQPAGDRVEVTLRGDTLPVDVRHPLERLLQSTHRAASGGAGETVTAPMPGLVASVRVAVGEEVEAGQAVAVIEAMKMQNELGARHAGRVAEVLVKAGDSVSGGQALLRLEPRESA
jgi:biotin carboxyl carrier protein